MPVTPWLHYADLPLAPICRSPIGSIAPVIDTEMPHWRAAAAAGKDFLVGAVGAADFTVYPFFALALRMLKRDPSLGLDAAFGPQLTAWMRRVEALPYFEKTIPPHWRT